MKFWPLLLLLCPLFAHAQSVCSPNTVQGVGNVASPAAPSCQTSLSVASIAGGTANTLSINVNGYARPREIQGPA